MLCRCAISFIYADMQNLLYQNSLMSVACALSEQSGLYVMIKQVCMVVCLPHQVVLFSMSSLSNQLITQSLAPAVALSGFALMTMGLLNRLAHLGSRVRQLNQQVRDNHNPQRLPNIRQQIGMVLQRARMVRNALFMAYLGIGCMVLTAFFLALTALGFLPAMANLPIWVFLVGLFSFLSSVVQEMFEVRLALKALDLDAEDVYET
jgi:hypothetical protein